MFEKVLVKKPKRAKFDFSHGNTLSMQFGKLTPTEIRFIVPGDDVSVSMEQIIRVAPLPVPTFVNMKVRHDWFFVPLSMMYNQLALDTILGQSPSSVNRARVRNLTDYITVFTGYDSSYGNSGAVEPFVPGSIHDFFNLPVFSDTNMFAGGNVNLDFQAFMNNPTSATYASVLANTTIKGHTDSMPGPLLEPALAYHYIWRDWYRFTGISDNVNNPGSGGVLPWLENHVINSNILSSSVTASNGQWSNFGVSAAFYHGPIDMNKYLFNAYEAYLKKDPFTSSRYGTKPQVLIPTGTTGTIPNLRTASALQKFIDIITVSGQRYWDKVKAIWNETPSGMKCERAQFLARYMSYIKVGEVLTTATTSQANTGDYAGRGMLVDGKYLFKRHFTEHGWLMCISSIIPEMAYNGYDRQLTDWNILDTPVPSFANVGDQSILNREISVDYTSSVSGFNNLSFGDQFRYYAYKADVNRVHGDFLMRSFSPWTAVLTPSGVPGWNAMYYGRVKPSVWDKVFAVTASTSPFFTGRFFVDLTFHEFITRSLPNYIAYAL